MNKAYLSLLLCLVAPAMIRADVTPHALFSDGAVLQRGCVVPVWGSAGDGEKVTVKFAGQTVSAVASNGQWMLRLRPMRANAVPQAMIISGANTVEIKNILVGDVWVCSGQSNMQFEMHWLTDSAKQIALANDPLLRLLGVPQGGATQPKRDIAVRWSECTSQSVEWFSAVGYFFGRDVRQSQKVPVGLINSRVGGTAAENWLSWQALAANPKLQPIAGKQPVEGGPSFLYNAMIAPLQPFAIRGVIWYQGESNAYSASRALEYGELFQTLIKCWRDEWGLRELPFLFVQIAPHNDMVPEIRESQLLTWQQTPKTAMVVITDCGDAIDIHPKQKEPVGARLALAARAVAYGERLEYSGPVFRKMKVKGNKAILSFTHVGGGLVAKEGALKGFAMAGRDNTFVPAEAAIVGKTVIVSSKEVTQPVAVRYGWANVPDVNLFNKEGLPATPFRTDSGKGVTGK
jgi:sialate O-acetylesterase